MDKGFAQLKNVEAGSLIRLKSGTFAVLSQYSHDNYKSYEGYIVGSGEALHVDGESWVAVIDLNGMAESLGLMDGWQYPDDTESHAGVQGDS